MQTSIYIPDKVAKRLESFVERGSDNRNKVIVEAIEEFLDRQEQKREWSPQIQLWFEQPEIEEKFNLHREDHGWGEFTFDE